MMRLGPAIGATVLSLVGHLSLERVLEDHWPWLYRNRWRARGITFLVASVAPTIRAVSIYSGHGQAIAPYALIELTFFACAGSAVGIMKTFFWLYGKLTYFLRRAFAKRAAHARAAIASDAREVAAETKPVVESLEVEPQATAVEARGASVTSDDVEKTPEIVEGVSPLEAKVRAAMAAFEKEEGERVSRRLLFERALGATLLVGTTSTVGWGIVRGRHDFRIEEVVVKIPGLSPKLDGYTIAQISDVHVGTFVGDRELAEGFEKLRATKPDLVVVTGDLVDHDSAYCELFAREIAKIAARDGTYCIYGNHDYTTGHVEVAEALARAKVPLLVNQGLAIRAAEGGFSLLGLDEIWGRYWSRGGPNLEAAIATVRETDLPRIVLSHQPKTFRDLAGKCALQLSGHTHGGQINPGFRPADLIFEYVAGRYERNGSTLWVNRGFGTAGPPSRVGAPPEVTRVVLVSG